MDDGGWTQSHRITKVFKTTSVALIEDVIISSVILQILLETETYYLSYAKHTFRTYTFNDFGFKDL